MWHTVTSPQTDPMWVEASTEIGAKRIAETLYRYRHNLSEEDTTPTFEIGTSPPDNKLPPLSKLRSNAGYLDGVRRAVADASDMSMEDQPKQVVREQSDGSVKIHNRVVDEDGNPLLLYEYYEG